MSFTLRVRDEAEEDLLQGCEWYAIRRSGMGDRLLDAIDLLLQRIAAHPEQWAEGFRGIRRAIIPRFPYVIYFLVEGSLVEVIAISHGKLHPRTWQSRLS
jgi:plasmid stabilization system protein ParE